MNKEFVSKDKLDNYRVDLMLIHDTYVNNERFISKKANSFTKKYNDYSKNNNDKLTQCINDYATRTISYSLLESGITQMYHLFEQFVKMYFNLDVQEEYGFVKTTAKKYDYDLEENEYFDLMNKYRLLNNAIKHGGLDNLKKEYPELINGDTSDNEYGTILDDKLNITEENLDECCVCLYKYVEKMNCYFEDMNFSEGDEQ